MSYMLRMKKISTWFLLLLFAGTGLAQLRLVPDPSPQAVFGGTRQNLEVRFQNASGQNAENDLRLVLLQTSTATVVPIGEWPWKKLSVLPGQLVLERVALDMPAVRAETRFLVQWRSGRSNVIGQTEVLVYPTNLLTQLQVLAGEAPMGVFDPTDSFKPLLRKQRVEYADLLEDGPDKFSGQLAIFGPFALKSPMRASLQEDIRALAKRGVAVVWLLPPPEKRQPLQPSFYVVRAEGGAVVVAAHSLVAQLAERPEAQLNLLRLAEAALHPRPLDLPQTSN
jgi:hypothetical protein